LKGGCGYPLDGVGAQKLRFLAETHGSGGIGRAFQVPDPLVGTRSSAAGFDGVFAAIGARVIRGNGWITCWSSTRPTYEQFWLTWPGITTSTVPIRDDNSRRRTTCRARRGPDRSHPKTAGPRRTDQPVPVSRMTAITRATRSGTRFGTGQARRQHRTIRGGGRNVASRTDHRRSPTATASVGLVPLHPAAVGLMSRPPPAPDKLRRVGFSMEPVTGIEPA